jgi:branched-chain amino acid transport system substrate-binding protein
MHSKCGACILLLLAASGVEDARADVAIGFSTPLTGPHAWVGEPHLAGTELAIADLNAEGGVLGSRCN